MPSRTHIFLPSALSLPVDADVYTQTKTVSIVNELPLLIFSHGFKGFKNWGGFPYMLETISERGFITAGFNFSHNGVSPESPEEFTRADLFAENTISKELDDLQKLIDYFYENSDLYNIDRNRIALMGHSRGGGTSLIKASEDKRVRAIVTLASVATFDRYTDEQKKRWREKGFIEIPNARTGQIMKMNKTYLEDIEENSVRFDICRAVNSLKIPYLIIHGKEDLSVKYTDAEKLYGCSDKNLTELEIIENTGHTFGIEHPFKGTTPTFDKVIQLISDFLNKVFR